MNVLSQHKVKMREKSGTSGDLRENKEWSLYGKLMCLQVDS